MTEQQLIILALISVGVIGVLLWIDYRRSSCELGGGNEGRNNWHFGGDGRYDLIETEDEDDA